MAESFWEETVTGADFEINVFAKSGFSCITTLEIAAVGLGEGEEVIIQPIDCWWTAPSGAVTLDKDNPTMKVMGTFDDCCWSISSGTRLVGQLFGKASVLIKGKCLGLPFDCPEPPEESSSSSSGTYYACVCSSSSSE